MSELVSLGTGGLPRSVHRLLSAAGTTNATSVKANAADLYTIIGNNARASISYLKLYNKASAPTVGTDVPVATIALPASLPFALDFPALYFNLGLAYAFTTAGADADTGALTAADITCLNIIYA